MGLARKFSYRSNAGRRNFWAMILVTACAFFVSFIFAHQGNIDYERYIAAHEQCYFNAMGNTAAVAACLEDPQVSALLASHRNSYERGEPFFNLGLFLTFLVIMGSVVKIAVEFWQPEANEHTGNGAASGTA